MTTQRYDALPPAGLIAWLGRYKMIGLSTNQICAILEKPDGMAKFRYRLAVHGFDFLLEPDGSFFSVNNSRSHA